MKIVKFKFFHGVKHYSSIVVQRYMESRDERTSLNTRYTFFHNNAMVSNNFKLFIDSKRLEQLRTMVRGMLSQHQIQYLDWRINHLTLTSNEERF
jgi:hypothetical protein